MAETVHPYLKSNGSDITGQSTQTSLGRADSIECLYFEDSVRTAREKGSGLATGRRTYEPIRILKRIDKSSPLLAKSLCNNEKVDGVFKFFRPNEETGETEHFFTVEIEKGRLAGIKRVSPNVIDPAAGADPPTEEVTFVFHTITWTFEDGGVMHSDRWDGES